MANAIRFLSIDAIELANSGHPGMPMGMADVVTVLFSEFLNFNPKDPKWLNRDRFILSAGHGSMLIYSLLYLTGYEDITIDDIKKFRQLGSKCAGHPEYDHFAGIETTTGPLGQGVANAVGMAVGKEILAKKIGENFLNHKVYCVAGDGCLMEGISQEAISLAGHLNLKNLIILWDNNSISIDGKTSLATSENMKMRFEACGFEVIQIDGHDFDQIRDALNKVQKSEKPVMIDCKTTIAFGSPNKSGSEKSHGSPLGVSETEQTRKNLNWNYQPFEIPEEILLKWRSVCEKSKIKWQKWNQDFESLETSKKDDLNRILNKKLPADFAKKIIEFKQKIFLEKPTQATRKSSANVLEFLTSQLSELIGGSADLTESVLTKTSSTKSIDKNDFSGRYIHYGIREHAMGAIMNGLSLYGNFIPYGGTFLVFSDYMKPAIRIAALMKRQVIYILTHDSIGLGEDGPTHQPIEHLAMLRSIPNLNVFRPCDAIETLESFEIALEQKETPSAIILTRQNLKFLQKNFSEKNNSFFGGYIISNCLNPQATLIATGSEVSLAVEAQENLAKENISVRVVSIPCFELFDQQSQDYKNEILGEKNHLKIGIEAAISQGWHKYLGSNSSFIGMESFGASGKGEDLFNHFKINVDTICKIVKKYAKN